MTQLPIGQGDSLSKLLQIRAAAYGISLKWSGKAIEDIDLLCMEYFHRKTLNDSLWAGVKQLLAMPELHELPQSMQAQIYSIVLQARAAFEMARSKRIAGPVPADGGVP